MKYYRLKYRLSITHSASGNRQDSHNHVLEVEVSAYHNDGEFIEFADMENMVNEALSEYQNMYLNDIDEFAGNTSIENTGEIFFRKLSEVFNKNNWEIARFEIGENPLRIYAISNGTLDSIYDL